MSKVLDVSGAEVVNNADWLHKMSFTELLKLSAQITVAQMMTRDDFAKDMQMENQYLLLNFSIR